MRTGFLIGISLIFARPIQAQNQDTYAGIVLKMLTPNSVFRTKNIALVDSTDALLNVSNTISYGMGMNIRKNISKTWAIEGGVFYLKRSYHFELQQRPTQLKYENNYDIISYEIPLHALMYIPLNKNLYTSAGLGFALNFLATEEYENGTVDMLTFSRRTSWIKPCLSMSYGFEFRSMKQGFLYVGASYQMHFSDLYRSRTNSPLAHFRPLEYGFLGNYVSLDVKWFFRED